VIGIAALLLALPAFAADTTEPRPLAIGDAYVLRPDAFTPDEQVPSPIGVSVRDTGAVGDGVADDTTAFETAITKAKSNGQSVVVPPGTYRLTRTLTLGQQALVGAIVGTWNADSSSLPKILVQCTSGPCIRLQSGGTVHGLQFTYDWGGQSPSARPPTIELAGVGCRVSELRISNAWDAIMADGSSNVGRSIIEKCFIVNVHNVGVRFLGSSDCSWISKVEIWSPSSSTFPVSGIGFQLAKCDALIMSNCFVFKANICYHLVNQISGCSITGGVWGTFLNCTADFSTIGMQIEGEHGVSLEGGTYWTHYGGMLVKAGSARVRISGVELRANGGPSLEVQGGDFIAITGSQLRRDASGFTQPALRVTGGNGTVVTGCVIHCWSSAIEVSPGLPGIVIADNLVREP